jgi:hypothetical protein
MNDDTYDSINGLINETIAPALYEDLQYNSPGEFEEIKRALIEMIREIEYIDQGNESDYDEDEE